MERRPPLVCPLYNRVQLYAFTIQMARGGPSLYSHLSILKLQDYRSSMASIPTLFLHRTILFLLLLLPPVPAAAQAPRNFSLSSSLTPLGQNTFLLSPSGDFAVGFRRLESNSTLFLLAIWFEHVPDLTVVWTANRNNPVQAGSKFELTGDGRLLLSDQAGQEIWSAGAVATNVTHATMLNSGNFVLVAAGSSTYAWESFREPTDTILPSQVLELGSQLSSRLMVSDYSDGRFLLRVQADGNLVFYPSAAVSCPNGDDCAPYDPYWASDTVGTGKQLVFTGDGDVYFARTNGSTVNITSAARSYPTREFYHRATLDPDGVLRQYAFPRNGTGAGGQGGGWTVVAAVASDICFRLRSSVGGGVCGFNGYCTADAGTQMMTCSCPLRYSFVDPVRQYKGCKPDFAPQSCAADGDGLSRASEFRIQRMSGTDWPLSDYDHLKPVSEDQCSNACLGDCFCAVAIHRDTECWMKRLPLSNGRFDARDGGTALLKLPREPINNTVMPQPPAPQSRTDREERTWLLVLLGAANCLTLAAVFLLACRFYHKKTDHKLQRETNKLGNVLRSFTHKELEEATQGFTEEVGRGAFGTVYRGVIGPEPRTPIAVKKLHDVDDVAEKEFVNEVSIIAQTHHRNLVRLLGYCNEGRQRFLVYEYMSNGSLIGFLLGSMKPDWTTRVQIAYGVARGILYLHEECNTQIIHCDIKPQNVLIDEQCHARISDFGLAKLLKTDQTRTNTGIRGTRGYVAPEWFKHMAITSKVDVYSFGVLLLEIICCRKNVEPEVGEGENAEKAVLAYWAYDCFRGGRLDLLVENEAEPLADVRRLERLVMVAIWCIQEEPSLRPTMKKVTQMLEGAVEVPIPPDPSSYMSAIN